MIPFCATDLQLRRGIEKLRIRFPTDDVHDAAQGFGSDGDLDGRSGVDDFLTADQTLSTVHGDGTDGVLPHVLGDFQDQAGAAVGDFEGVQDGGEGILELDVYDGTNDGHNLAVLHRLAGADSP